MKIHVHQQVKVQRPTDHHQLKTNTEKPKTKVQRELAQKRGKSAGNGKVHQLLKDHLNQYLIK